MSTPSHRTYYPALDGLRGIAILLVVCYHNFGFINYLFFGWLGVDLFFVLSGFLITDILLKTREEPHYLRNFFGRRMLRIFPLYYLTLVTFLLVIPQVNRNILSLDYYVQNQAWLWMYLQNWLYSIYPPPGEANALMHLWSLAVEEQFYLVWPFVILLVKKPKNIFFLVLALLAGVIALRLLLWTYKIENLAYFNLYTFTRIDGICIGSMLAALRHFDKTAVTKYFTIIVFALAAFNFGFYFFNKSSQFSFPYLALAGYTTFAILFGLFLNHCITHSTDWLNRLLSISPFRFFGRISYGLYIFHWPLYLLLKPFWREQQLFDGTNIYISSILSTLLAILLATFSYYLFEMPFLRLKKHFQ